MSVLVQNPTVVAFKGKTGQLGRGYLHWYQGSVWILLLSLLLGESPALYELFVSKYALYLFARLPLILNLFPNLVFLGVVLAGVISFLLTHASAFLAKRRLLELWGKSVSIDTEGEQVCFTGQSSHQEECDWTSFARAVRFKDYVVLKLNSSLLVFKSDAIPGPLWQTIENRLAVPGEKGQGTSWASHKMRFWRRFTLKAFQWLLFLAAWRFYAARVYGIN